MRSLSDGRLAPDRRARRPGESNAIVFANAVLGARTHRYGDFLDIAAAITGRALAAGLHLDTARHDRLRRVGRARNLLDLDVAYPVTGTTSASSSAAPFPSSSAHRGIGSRLKAIGSAGTSGSLAMFHVVGSTPEAPTSKPHAWPSPDRPPHDHRRRSSLPGIDSRPRPRETRRDQSGDTPLLGARICSADRTAR